LNLFPRASRIVRHPPFLHRSFACAGVAAGGTDGATLGGTDGGTLGGTDGGTLGGTLGGTDGGTLGGTDGGTLGSTDGGTLGGTDGGTLGGTISVTTTLSSAGPLAPGVVLVKVSTVLAFVATNEYSCVAQSMFVRVFPMLVSNV
jgi:hypothetical protein